MGLCLWPWDKTNVATMEDTVITSAKESKAGPVKPQDNAEWFLSCGGSGASCISSPRPQHESDYLQNHSAMPSRCSVRNGLKNGLPVPSAPWQDAMLCGPRCLGILSQVQHPSGFPSASFIRFAPLATSDLFLRLNSTLKEKWFQDVTEIQLNMTWQLQAILKWAYQTCTEKWRHHWNHCRQSGGSYFEGGNSRVTCNYFRFPTINFILGIFDQPLRL
jgi:hypothetical protein